MKLFFAAPESFLAVAALSHDAVASDAHLVMKLLSAAPASFFSSARSLQVCFGDGSGNGETGNQKSHGETFHTLLEG